MIHQNSNYWIQLLMQRSLVKSFAPLHKLVCCWSRFVFLSTVPDVGMSDPPLLFSVGLTRSHLILAPLFLDHGATWSKAEQRCFLNSLWWVTCVCFQTQAEGPRLSADMGAGGTDARLTSGKQCHPEQSPRRVVPSPVTCICPFCWSFIFVLTWCNEGACFNPGSSPGLSIKEAGFVIHQDSVFRNISYMKEEAQ